MLELPDAYCLAAQLEQTIRGWWLEWTIWRRRLE